MANFDPPANTLLSFLEAKGGQITLPPVFSANQHLSLLQVIAFFFAWAGCWLPLAIVCANAIDWRPSKPLSAEQKLPLLASLYLIAPVVLWGVRWVLGASFLDYGFAWRLSTLRSAGVGLGFGVLSLMVLFGIQTALGWITWQPANRQQLASVLLPTLLLALWVSATEQLIFRGFVLTQLNQDYRPWVAAAISSLIFALLHLVWEREETMPQLPGLWLMGMVLVLARYVDDGSLGLAWGVHSGWVWVIASLDSAQIITYTGIGSEWVTGKNGKPLAGAAGIVCLLASGGILWWFFV
jgi:membrane protease YdiL (CAAX protease family)